MTYHSCPNIPTCPGSMITCEDGSCATDLTTCSKEDCGVNEAKCWDGKCVKNTT